MKHKMVKLLGIAFISLLLLGACSSKESDHVSKKGDNRSKEKTSQNVDWKVTKENPIYIDEENKVVYVYATVNGKYLVEPTRHGLNWVDGKYGKMAVLNAYANPIEFSEALEKIGLTPAVEKGGDASKEFKVVDGRQYIKGDPVKIQITWDDADKVYDIGDVMVDSTGKPFDFHFGGNYDSASKKMTGCYMCFDSCPVGITSNASHPTGTFEKGEAEFHGNPDVLPEDGTPVMLTYSAGK